MKKMITIFLTVAFFVTSIGIVFGDPQNGGDDPFAKKYTYTR